MNDVWASTWLAVPAVTQAGVFEHSSAYAGPDPFLLMAPLEAVTGRHIRLVELAAGWALPRAVFHISVTSKDCDHPACDMVGRRQEPEQPQPATKEVSLSFQGCVQHAIQQQCAIMLASPDWMAMGLRQNRAVPCVSAVRG